jgi:hypothetical protein
MRYPKAPAWPAAGVHSLWWGCSCPSSGLNGWLAPAAASYRKLSVTSRAFGVRMLSNLPIFTLATHFRYMEMGDKEGSVGRYKIVGTVQSLLLRANQSVLQHLNQ